VSGFIEGENRYQSTLFPEALDDYVADGTAPRIIDLFIDKLDLNQVHSSRRLEREAARNVELMWLTGRLAPDHKTIANFRKDNGEAIRLVCREFVMLCRKFGLLADAFVEAPPDRRPRGDEPRP
jgi:transposase